MALCRTARELSLESEWAPQAARRGQLEAAAAGGAAADVSDAGTRTGKKAAWVLLFKLLVVPMALQVPRVCPRAAPARAGRALSGH